MIGLASFLISIPAILLLWISLDSSNPCMRCRGCGQLLMSNMHMYSGTYLVPDTLGTEESVLISEVS